MVTAPPCRTAVGNNGNRAPTDARHAIACVWASQHRLVSFSCIEATGGACATLHSRGATFLAEPEVQAPETRQPDGSREPVPDAEARRSVNEVLATLFAAAQTCEAAA